MALVLIDRTCHRLSYRVIVTLVLHDNYVNGKFFVSL